jgi:hypothetical protein
MFRANPWIVAERSRLSAFLARHSYVPLIITFVYGLFVAQLVQV